MSNSIKLEELAVEFVSIGIPNFGTFLNKIKCLY